MSVYDMVYELGELAEERSKKYNNGKVCYSFALGWIIGAMQANLDNMELSKKQMKVLEDRIVRMRKLVGEQ